MFVLLLLKTAGLLKVMNTTNMISIEEFYKTNSIDLDFDEKIYVENHPDTIDFYQPYCSDNGITEKERLYFHYYLYGRNNCTQRNKTILIKAVGNIAQRLRVINSYLSFGNQIGAKVFVYWSKDHNAAGYEFTDLFENITHINFIDYTTFLNLKSELIHLHGLYARSSTQNLGFSNTYSFFAEPRDVLGLISSVGFCYEGCDAIEDLFNNIIDSNIIYKNILPKNNIQYFDSRYITAYFPNTKQQLHVLDIANIINKIKTQLINEPDTKILLITEYPQLKEAIIQEYSNKVYKYKNVDSGEPDVDPNKKTKVDQLCWMSQSQMIIANCRDSFVDAASRIGNPKLLILDTTKEDKNLVYEEKYNNLINNVISYNHHHITSKNKIILYTQMFKASTEVLSYNTYCLYKNLANKHIDEVVLLVDQDCEFINVFSDKLILYPIHDRLTYKEWLEISYKLHPNDIKVLANSDIYFDDTISKLHNIKNWSSDTMYVSSRKDITKDDKIVPSRLYHNNICPIIDIERSQDVWVYKNPLKTFDNNYYLGFMGCDSKMSESLMSQNMQIINLYFYINCLHIDWRETKTRPSYSLNNV